jgi:hypothetical protein
MERWVAENPQGKHGSHEYRGDEFGLDESLIRDRFAEYLERHDLGA